jgi:hypothetical protein
VGHIPRSEARHSFHGRPGRKKGRSQKSKAQVKTRRRATEDSTHTLEESEETTLSGLKNLGTQKFALSPFCDNFDLWITSLKTLLARFESSKLVTMDDQYVTECDLAVSSVESSLKALQLAETSGKDCLRKLADARNHLSDIEEEYHKKKRELRNSSTRETESEPERFRTLPKDLTIVDRLRISLFGSMTRKDGRKREGVPVSQPNLIENQLNTANARSMSFTDEEIRLREEYEKERNLALENLRTYEKEAENSGALSQLDESLAVRRLACDTIADSIRGLIERTQRNVT